MADELETLLKAWGVAYAERPVNVVDPVTSYERRSSSHPISTAMQFAPGRKVKKTVLAAHLAGMGRRLYMGRAADLKGPVPRWAADRIRAKETRVYGRADRTVHPELARIDEAVRALETRNLVRGTCLRVNYCLAGTHAEKVEEVTARMRQAQADWPGISIDTFRDHLLYARLFVEGWRAHAESAA